MKMNPRLKSYLRSLGLQEESNEDSAWEFYRSLRGVQATIANCLNYSESDSQARGSCDIALRALGVDPMDPTKQLESKGERSDATPGTDGVSLMGDLEAAAEQRGAELERQRRASIEQFAVMAGTSEDLRDELINSNANVDTARDRIWEDHQSRTRADVPADVPGQAPAGHTRNSLSPDVAVLEAAMLHARNLDPTETWAENDNGTPRRRRITPDLERAIDDAWQYRAMSLEDMIRACARIDGVELPHGRTGLLQAYLQRGMSTAALSAVFTTNVNSELLSGYMVTEDTTTGGWVRDSDVADFRINERARMKNGGALKKLPRGGEAEHATYEDLVETFKIARYAKQFVIDDQDIQDDNFGGVSGFVPTDMGVAARQLRPDLIYSILMGNPNMRDGTALFHADHGNLTGSAALDGANLKSARKAMRIQQENGRNLDIKAKFLIVPPELEDTADVLVKSRVLITGEDSTQPENNPNAGKGLVVVADPRLENGVTDPTDGTGGTVHAGSATTWFMSAVAAAHTIECAYLRGTGRAPQIRPFVLTQGRWGLGWDVKMDIGAKALDWLGMRKNTA